MPDIETIERLLRTTAVHGLGFVVLACGAGIFLYGLFFLVRYGVDIVGGIAKVLRDGVPKWFGSQVDMHQAVIKGVDAQTETMREQTATMREIQTTQKDMQHSISETNKGVTELLGWARRRQDDDRP